MSVNTPVLLLVIGLAVLAGLELAALVTVSVLLGRSHRRVGLVERELEEVAGRSKPCTPPGWQVTPPAARSW